MNQATLDRLRNSGVADLTDWLDKTQVDVAASSLAQMEASALQAAWERSDLLNGPYALVDHLGEVAARAVCWLPSLDSDQTEAIALEVLGLTPDEKGLQASGSKLRLAAAHIVAGAAVTASYNVHWRGREEVS